MNAVAKDFFDSPYSMAAKEDLIFSTTTLVWPTGPIEETCH